jgi:hypothetical protein
MNSSDLFELAKNLQHFFNHRLYVFKKYVPFNKKDCMGEFNKDSSSPP